MKNKILEFKTSLGGGIMPCRNRYSLAPLQKHLDKTYREARRL